MGENPSPLGDYFSRLAVIMKNYRKTSHSVYDLKYHFVWITKDRKPVLFGNVGTRLRDLIVKKVLGSSSVGTRIFCCFLRKCYR